MEWTNEDTRICAESIERHDLSYFIQLAKKAPWHREDERVSDFADSLKTVSTSDESAAIFADMVGIDFERVDWQQIAGYLLS